MAENRHGYGDGANFGRQIFGNGTCNKQRLVIDPALPVRAGFVGSHPNKKQRTEIFTEPHGFVFRYFPSSS